MEDEINGHKGKKKESRELRSISFSVEERNNLQKEADRQGVSFSAYVRNAALKVASDLQLDNTLIY